MRPINRILCPLDFSDVSRNAIDHAVLMARWCKARITALHVCNPIVIPAADITMAGTVPPPLLADDELKEVRERVAACFDSAKPLDVDVIVDTGHPANCILERARSLPADLIVIGTHGASGFEHLILGSVTEKVLRKATCPVMTVPPHARATSKLPFERLLCPVDFAESSLSALAFALSLSREADAAMTIVHAIGWPDENVPPTAQYRRECERDLMPKLLALVPEATSISRSPTVRLAHGKAYREILTVATEENADLIVMGVHGRNPLDLMLFGSTTNQVVRRATCPVLTLRA